MGTLIILCKLAALLALLIIAAGLALYAVASKGAMRAERASEVADWRCTRCGGLKSRILASSDPWPEGCTAMTSEACPMVPINAAGDVLPH